MGERTNILWTDATFNPWLGCTKISPGCDHCYAEHLMDKRMHKVVWGAGQARVRTSAGNWREPLRWNTHHAEFFAKHGRRQRVFCASLADVFDNAVDPLWRADLFRLILDTPNLDWLLLTKRIGNAWPMAQDAMWEDGFHPAVTRAMPDNVWIGATIVNQEEADRDIPKLLEVPAKVRFLSMEPLLGPVDLRVIDIDGHSEIHPLNGTTDCEDSDGNPSPDLPAIDWVIVGGESGHGARPMHPSWPRSLRDQCAAAGVAFLFKQWGEWHTAAFVGSTGEPVFRQFTSFEHWVNKASTWVNGGICLDRHGRELKIGADFMRARDNGDFPVTIMHRVGKKAAGRQLDGRTYDEFPGREA